MNEQFVMDVFTRFAVLDGLLAELYLQVARTADDPDQALTDMEKRISEVMASLRPPASGIEDWGIAMLKAQREEGPARVQDFFRKVRSNRTPG